MKTALFKDGIKEIKNSYKRFISILLIVLLGVGFFAGIRAASPDMKKTIDEYFDSLNVFDVQVISTLGLTDDDIIAIKNIQDVENVEGTYQTDAIVKVEDEEAIAKIETFSENINKLDLIDGKFPENKDECVVEPRVLEETGYKIGDTIEIEVEDITNDDGEKEAVLKENKVKIVGTVKSPIYISTDRGSTKLGSGVIDYYMYISKENINVDLYTNIYLTVSGAKDLDTTSNKYSETVGKVKDELENISDERREARYNELYDSANSKIEDAQKELDIEKEKAEKEIQDAEKEIQDGKKQLEDGRKELETNRANANSKFASATKQIEEAKTTLEENKKKYEQEKKKAEEQIEEYEGQLSSLVQIQKQLNNANSSLKTMQANLSTLEKQLEESESVEEKDKIQEQINTLNVEIQKLQMTISIIKTELEKEGITDLDETINKLQSGIETAKKELEDGESKLQEAQKQIEESEKELTSQKSSTYYQLNEAENKLEASAKEIEEGEKELEEAKKEFNEKIGEAEAKLLEAKEDLNDIEKPEWFVLDRNQNVGYASYVQDTDRVASLAEVFPIVFFLVAALISLTSMSRMVEEQRVQIGTLKALGYSKRQIASKYLIYASLATIIGGMIGLFIGFKFLPKVIADMYGMVYTVPEVILEFNASIAFTGMAFAVACTVGATLYTSIRELRHNPATLMRPKSPKAGKRVLLEKITFIWKHLNFTAKVTARNLFRYKKRFLMTIIGVCGCTSLIVAGFGLRDAIVDMVPKQFGEIDKYDINITLKEDKYGNNLENLEESLKENEKIERTLGANIQSVKVIKDDNNQSIQLIVPEDVNGLEEFISLRDRKDKDNKYILDNTGVIVSEKLANLLDIKKGDTILLENADGIRKEVQVSNITENYIMHYIYMAPELYDNIFNTRIESNVILAKTVDMTEDEENDLGEILLKDSENISGVNFTSTSHNMFETVMENMQIVVWILIIAAGLLALVVLYNLLNANISERIRELATIKVLGFYDKEVYSYIARETIILTIIGIIVGLVGGYFLTMYILKTCELDITMFNPEVKLLSYIFGILITVFFAIIVNVITYFSLKKIDMIESLKSVE